MDLTHILELRTLLATNIVSMLICFAVMGIVWWNNRERFPATTCWLFSLGLQFVAFSLILLRGRIPDTLSIVLAAGLVSTSFILLLRGLSLHLDRPYPIRHDHALQLIFLLIQAYFTYLTPSLFWRSINYSAFLAWFSLECVWQVYRAPVQKRFAADILAVVMAAYALLFLGRIAYYAVNTPSPDFFQAGDYDLFFYMGTQALLVTLTFCFVLMVNRRLYHDLKEDIKDRLKAEAVVQINMERLARAELASRTGNWEFDLDTGVVTGSVGAARIYGLSVVPFDYERIKKLAFPEYRALLDSALNGLIEQGLPYDVEFRIQTADTGEAKEIHSTAELDVAQRAVFGVIQDITERKKIEHALEHLVQVDPLTGVFSRRHFMSMTEHELAKSARYASPLSVFMLDIDHFKQVNDTYGHQVGDRVLQYLGDVFRGLLREVDIVGRYGGEEFAVVLPRTDLVQAFEVSERLRRTVERCEIPLERGLPISVTVSIGVTTLKDAAENIDALLARADRALYDAKHQGRNQVCIYEIGIGSESPEAAAPRG